MTAIFGFGGGSAESSCLTRLAAAGDAGSSVAFLLPSSFILSGSVWSSGSSVAGAAFFAVLFSFCLAFSARFLAVFLVTASLSIGGGGGSFTVAVRGWNSSSSIWASTLRMAR